MRPSETEEEEAKRRRRNHQAVQIAYRHFLSAHERFLAATEKADDNSANAESQLTLQWLREWRDMPEEPDVSAGACTN